MAPTANRRPRPAPSPFFIIACSLRVIQPGLWSRYLLWSKNTPHAFEQRNSMRQKFELMCGRWRVLGIAVEPHLHPGQWFICLPLHRQRAGTHGQIQQAISVNIARAISQMGGDPLSGWFPVTVPAAQLYKYAAQWSATTTKILFTSPKAPPPRKGTIKSLRRFPPCSFAVAQPDLSA